MDDHKLPGQDPTSPIIPDLKKKDEEEKKRGAGWFSRAGGSGATVRTGSSLLRSPSSLLGSLERVAQSMARSIGLGNPLGRLLMSKAGAWLVLAAACAPAALFLVAGILGTPDTTGRYGSSSPLSAPLSSGRIHSGRAGAGLDMVANANKGMYDEGASPSVDAPAASAPAAESPAPAEPAVPETPAAPAAPAGLSHEGFAQKLAGAVGGGGGGGGHYSAPAGQLKDKGIEMKLGNSFKSPLAGGGKLSSLSRAGRVPANNRLSAVRGKSNKAMGQLKLADNLSRAGAKAGGDSSKQYAADAFDQQRSQGAATDGGGLNTGAVTTPSSGGAADVTDTPSVGAGQNVTPYQDKVDSAKSSSNMALILTLIGAALIALGYYLYSQAETLGISAAIGAVVMALGAMMVLMGLLSANAAKQKGEEIKDKYGQEAQGEVIDECADQATNKQNCNPKPVDQKPNTVKTDATKESNATYDNGGPISQ
ncbi:MAG: hypothetical protein WC969_05120 [Elusimicrobiota bacterium]|jgi:hypothetical protein